MFFIEIVFLLLIITWLNFGVGIERGMISIFLFIKFIFENRDVFTWLGLKYINFVDTKNSRISITLKKEQYRRISCKCQCQLQ